MVVYPASGALGQVLQAAAEAARDAGDAASPAADAAPGLPDSDILDSEQPAVAPTTAAAAAAPPAAETTGSPQQTSSGHPGATGSTDSAQTGSAAAAEPAALRPPVADYDAGSLDDTQPEPGFPEQPSVPPGSAAQPSRGFALGAVPVDASQFMQLRYLVMMREEGSGRAVAVSLQGGEEAVLAFEVGCALHWSCS